MDDNQLYSISCISFFFTICVIAFTIGSCNTREAEQETERYRIEMDRYDPGSIDYLEAQCIEKSGLHASILRFCEEALEKANG